MLAAEELEVRKGRATDITKDAPKIRTAVLKAVLDGVDPSKLGSAREHSVRALGDVLKSFPAFESESKTYLRKDSPAAFFVEALRTKFESLGKALGESEPVGTAKGDGDFFKRARVLRTSLTELIEILKGRESVDLKFVASEIIGAVGRIEDIAELRKRDLVEQETEIPEGKSVFAVISERFAVKDVSGIFYYSAAIGPISKDEASKYREVVEIGDSLYTPIGRTFNSREKYERGDVIKVETSNILLDTSDDKIRVRWFTPVVLGKIEDSKTPSTVKEIIEHAGSKTAKNEKVLELFDRAVTDKLPIFKRDEDEERFVLGIVLKPEVPDSQKEIYSAEEIRKTAHGFMEFHANMGRQHTANVNGRIKILESFLAPVDFEINGRMVKKGTWLLGMRIVDDGIWKDIKSGKLTGLSIGGTAVRIPNRAMEAAA